MGDGDLPPLEHVRAGIEAVHDEAEKPPDRQPRASRQGPPRASPLRRHNNCSSGRI
jgi:cytochrome c556